MNAIAIFTVLFLALETTYPENLTIKDVDYCSLDCKRSHTFCRFPLSRPKPPCLKSPLSAKEKLELLNIQNKWRHEAASGRLENLPSSSNMLRLRWDDELEVSATRWAGRCRDQHDKCRVSPRFAVGQNIAFRFTWDPQAMIDGWWDEHIKFPITSVNSYVFHSSYGHFSQSMWAKTFLVGCGRAERPFWALKFVLVCNYGPAGNIQGAETYLQGLPSSECPPGTKRDEEYSGLCRNDSANFLEAKGVPKSFLEQGVLVWPNTFLKSRVFKGERCWAVSFKLSAHVRKLYLLLFGTVVTNSWRLIM